MMINTHKELLFVLPISGFRTPFDSTNRIFEFERRCDSGLRLCTVV